MKPARPIIPEWLSHVLQDKSPGPKIYRWTADDVTGSSTKSAVHRSVDDAQRRIYILGIGNLGRLFAASFARLHDRPPITLVVHRPALLEQWRLKPGVVLHPPSYLESGSSAGEDARITNFDVEMWSDQPPPAQQGSHDTDTDADTAAASAEIGVISNLIIATKAQDALRTADWLRRYLRPKSAVAFAQNGMNKLWPPYGDIYNTARYTEAAAAAATATAVPSSPLWLACIVTHGVFSLGPFESVHASPADVVFGAVGDGDLLALGSAKKNNDDDDNQMPYLVRQLLAASQLRARWAPRPELWILQLEKLVVNSVINPLTAILRCKNGDLFTCSEEAVGSGATVLLPKIIDQLLEEASAVLRALALYEIENGGIFGQATAAGAGASSHRLSTNSTRSSQSLVERLSFENLRSMVYRVGDKVKDNTSSMLQDVLAGKTTEVGEVNGWIVEMARYLESVGATKGTQIDVSTHQTMIDLVEGKAHLSKDQLDKYFPAVMPPRT